MTKYTYRSLEKMWVDGYLNFLKNNIDKDYAWDSVSGNPSITWEIVNENQDLPWHYSGLSFNPNITIDIIKANYQCVEEDWLRIKSDIILTGFE